MDFNKMKNNKAIQIGLIIALPTVLVAGYFGYKFIKRKMDEKKENKFILDMRDKYKDINSIDDFIEGLKWVKQTTQFGYDLKSIGKHKDKLASVNFDELKDIYELLKKTLIEKTDDENKRIMDFLNNLYK